MATETVGILRALLTLDSAQFESGVRRSQKSFEQFSKSSQRIGANMRSLGTTLTATVTAPIVGLAAAAGKASIDFESSFAGVRKTVDATEPEFQQLAQGFRDMAKEIPINVNELNRLGEAAGQLGIETANILSFSETMAKLGVTTNLSAEEAATSLARLANITQLPQDQFDRLGSTIVDLGNNFATTEAEIVEFGLRIAGAGNQIGLSEAQILAVGTALSSVGINAEAGGTAISRVMVDIAKAVASGGEELSEFATVAGMTAEQFAQAFRDDAAGAIVSFVEGLGRVQSEGGNTFAILEQLGLSNIRVRDALLRSAGAGDLLREALATGASAWEENNALTAEAAQRFGTTASRLQLLFNRAKDVSITLGDALVPIGLRVVGMLEQLVPFLERGVERFMNLPAPVQSAAVGLAALAAAAGPVVFALGAMATGFGSLAGLIGPGSVIITGLLTVGKAILALATGPIGLIVGAIAGVVIAWRNWDTIGPIVQRTFEAVKMWMVDRFTAIVDSIRGKIDSVVGFFRNMKEAVVGNSFVPDMVKGIDEWFTRLDTVMVAKSQEAIGATIGHFRQLPVAISSVMGEVQDINNVMTMFQGRALAAAAATDAVRMQMTDFAVTLPTVTSGFSAANIEAEKMPGLLSDIASNMVGLGKQFTDVSGLVSSVAMGIFGPQGAIAGAVAQGMHKLGSLAFTGLKKIGGLFKSLFGGPSAKELAGREVVDQFSTNLSAMLTDSQRLEAGNERWKQDVIAIRDAYLEQGLSQDEALEDAARLWDSVKGGAENAERVIEEITSKMGGFGGTLQDVTAQARQGIRIPVDFNIGTLDLSRFRQTLEIPVRGVPMAEGGAGRVTRPTLFLAGEAGPEEFAFSGANKELAKDDTRLVDAINQNTSVLDRIARAVEARPRAMRGSMV